MEHYIKTLGFVAASLTTVSFLPQAIKTWKTRSTEDLSPLMFSLFFIGIIGWLFYGILINDLPMILANTITIVLAGTIMYFILFGKKSNKLEHVGIYANNIDQLAQFYAYWFHAKIGTPYTNKEKGFSSRFLYLGNGARIEFMHIEKAKPKVADQLPFHIAISVGSKTEVERLAQEMSLEGVNILDGPRTTGDGYFECLVEDPEGNKLEITI